MQDSWTLTIRHLLYLMIHILYSSSKKKTTVLLFSCNVQAFFLHFSLSFFRFSQCVNNVNAVLNYFLWKVV